MRKSQATLDYIRTYAAANNGMPPSVDTVMKATGASASLVWWCTSILRQTGVVTTARRGPRVRDCDKQRRDIARFVREHKRMPNLTEVKTLAQCGSRTAHNIRADYIAWASTQTPGSAQVIALSATQKPRFRAPKVQAKQIFWYAGTSRIARIGPFATSAEAWRAVRLPDADAEEVNRIHALGAYVWNEEAEVRDVEAV